MAQKREFNYKLTSSKIDAAKPKDKPYKLTDGGGLFLEVLTTGSRVWRYSYRHGGRRTKVTIGPYPSVGIAAARDAHAKHRETLYSDGANPAQVKQADRRQSRARVASFEEFAKLWVQETLFYRSEHTRKLTVGWLERDVYPRIGSMPIGEIAPRDVLEIVEGLRDRPSSAGNVQGILQRIFNYAIRKLLVVSNPAMAVRGAVKVPKAVSYRPLAEREVAAFFRTLDDCGAHKGTKLAIWLSALAVVRKGNVCMARWEHFDLDAAEWTIPGLDTGGNGNMKMERPHRVYLSRQALVVVKQARALSEGSPWLFPSIYKRSFPMGPQTINHVFSRLHGMGVPSDFKPHGLRATASTFMNEAGHIRADVIEKILAHEQKGVRGVYNVAEYAKERREALQWYADRLDELRDGAKVIPLRA